MAATALGYSGPRIIVTSDLGDMNKLCGDRVRVMGVWHSRVLAGREARERRGQSECGRTRR
ncbi:hypothetical protein [Streptomyces sp. NBC_00287]|uniref:hypothetical protein n=1 Tax=Streptomyces sp. NBC_00287 TaxID=2975702 RepID=UPI002E2AE0AB|nr:hypothetical protein [Streptomyces sp. NBC_00287]